MEKENKLTIKLKELEEENKHLRELVLALQKKCWPIDKK